MRNILRHDPVYLSLKGIKKQSLLLLVITSAMFALFVYVCVTNFKDGMIGIHAHPTYTIKKGAPRTHDNYDYAEYSSTLYYKPQSFFQSVVFSSIGRQNILHFICYLAIGLLLYLTLRDITDVQTFS